MQSSSPYGSVAGASARPGQRGLTRLLGLDGRAAIGFLAPWLVGLVVITLGPVLASLYLSFTHYDLFTAPTWRGLANYQRMFSGDPRFLNSVRVTFVYVAVSVPVLLAFALAMAMLLNRGLRGLTVYRALFYLPSLLGSSVALAVLWRRVFGVSGVVNQLLAVVHIHGPSWIGDPSTALSTLISLSVWTFGGTMVIFLAGLRQIPQQLYEAARVDGASRIRQFWHITVPMLSPVIFFNGILATIHGFQAFTSAFVVSGGTGGPGDATLFYSLYLYQQGFINFNMGYAAAMAWFLLIVVAAVTGIAFLTSRFWVFYGSQA